jgi:hypothetical protein
MFTSSSSSFKLQEQDAAGCHGWAQTGKWLASAATATTTKW